MCDCGKSVINKFHGRNLWFLFSSTENIRLCLPDFSLRSWHLSLFYYRLSSVVRLDLTLHVYHWTVRPLKGDIVTPLRYWRKDSLYILVWLSYNPSNLLSSPLDALVISRRQLKTFFYWLGPKTSAEKERWVRYGYRCFYGSLRQKGE